MTTSEYGNTPENNVDKRIHFIDKMIDRKKNELALMQPEIITLLNERHAHYDMPRTMFEDHMSIENQVYDDPTYNDTFIHGNHIVDDSGEVKGGDLNARSAGESYEAENYDDNDYSKAIHETASKLGFVLSEYPDTPTDEIDQYLGIANSNTEKISTPVQAIIVPTAKSISNPIRIRGAIRDIESGKIKTDLLVIASCDREVDDAERALMESRGLHYGTTEYGSSIAALEDVTGIHIDEDDSQPFHVSSSPNLPEGKKVEVTVPIGDRDVRIVILSAPYDADRIRSFDSNGKPERQTRASSLDNFNAAMEFLPTEEGVVVVESHDTWTKSQVETAEQYMGVHGKEVVPAGPHKLDRLKMIDGEVVLNQPGQVADEIAKTFAFKVQTLRILENAKQDLIAKR
jgi:hypothetical protein